MIGLKLKENVGQTLPGHVETLLVKRLKDLLNMRKALISKCADPVEIKVIEKKIESLCNKLNVDYLYYLTK